MSVNPTLAPRHSPCRVCDLVAVQGDVTLRLFDAELNPLPLESAVEYLRAVGFTGTIRQLQAFALTHRRHVQRFIDQEGAMAPAQAEGISRIAAPIGKAAWVDVNQAVMNTGLQASEIIAERLRTRAEAMEVRDLVAIQASGSAAASKRADLELKGLLKRGESIARIAAGIDRPVE
jgi:hypothetical protein